MEEMNTSTTFSFNLPTEITEKIFLYLSLPDRKNLRLTCKRFYELCNSDLFCKYEKIKWSEDLIHHVNMESDLFNIGRCHYNLVIQNRTLEKSSILPFFEKLGTKIRSINICYCIFRPGSLECIIMLCEGLSSLSLDIFAMRGRVFEDYFTFEPLSITRPHVTNLKITVPPEKPYDYFHRMVSIFPNVKQLQIDEHPPTNMVSLLTDSDLDVWSGEWLAIRDDIMKFGCNLECLQLTVYKNLLLIIKTEFFEALPHLKQLNVNFGYTRNTGTEKWYPYCSNIQSVKLEGLHVFHPPEMIRLLTNTRLKYLSITSNTNLVFNKESFGKLVASQLATICFMANNAISGLPMTILDSPLEVNNTVKYLYLNTSDRCTQSTEMLFLKYFRGLIHLSLSFATDSILQCIFECQENLRSLRLSNCQTCTINGFCGSNYGGAFKYSINNLQKLEYLTLRHVPLRIFNSNYFKGAFSLTRLKYLWLNLERNNQPIDELQYTQIPTNLFENSTELRALRLSDTTLPTSETLTSLLRNRRYLNYLRYDLLHCHSVAVKSVTYIKKNCEYFSMTTKKFEHESRLGHAYHDKELDRVVILNEGLQRTFHSQETITYDIDWISA